MAYGKGRGVYMGHENEPPTRFKKDKGRQPPAHSHSSHPHRHIKGGLKKHHAKGFRGLS